MIKSLTDGMLRFACWVLAILTAKDCAKIRKMIRKSLESDLSRSERRCLKWHLWVCRHCFSRYEFSRLMRMATSRRITSVKAPRRLRNRVRRITI